MQQEIGSAEMFRENQRIRMKTVQTSLVSETDKKLHLEIPVEKAGQTYRVTVLVAEVSETNWPVGYLDSVIGKWNGEFVAEPEGEFEQRESL